MSKIIGLGIAKNSSQKIEEVSKAELIAGKGVVGDRHFHEKGRVLRICVISPKKNRGEVICQNVFSPFTRGH